jgi:hypothetical protein
MSLILVIRVLFLLIAGFVIARIDSKKHIIPDKITFPIIIFGIILSYLEFGISANLIYSYLIILGTYFFYYILCNILYLINKTQKIGGGDVKYSLVIASLLPFYTFMFWNVFIIKVVMIAFVLLFSMAIVKFLALLIFKKLPKKFQLVVSTTILQTEVIFAPILFISTIISLLI